MEPHISVSEGSMSYRSILAVAALIIVAIFTCQAQKPDQDKVERFIKESEAQWAEAGVKGDTETIERILADDFVGIAPDGSSYNKAKEIANTRKDQGQIVSNHVNEISVRFFGDTAVAQGSETWEQRAGDPKRGRYVWTDTWVRRKNKWQIVAAEDLLAPAGGTN
jgi:ketosteroid isomerase-like protein